MQEITLKISEKTLINVKNNFDTISSSKNQLITIHGLGTHGEWFSGLATLLEKNNINSIFFDLPGFGEPIQERGKIEFDNIWIKSIQKIWKYSVQNNPNKKNYLLGHSLGAVIALASIKKLNPKPDGLILTVPGLFPHPKTYDFFTFVLPTLYKVIFKSNENVKLPIIKEIEDAVKKGEITPEKLTEEISAKLFWQIQKIIFKAWFSFLDLKDIPILLLLAGEDEVCSSFASKIFFNLIPSKNKDLIIYENFGHDLFIFPESFQFNKKILNWILEKGI